METAADFLRNRDFSNLVAESDLPTPTHFVEQALYFCKNICSALLKHKICKSKLVRGFSIFDEAIVRHGEEEDYSHESEVLCDYLVENKWMGDGTKPLVCSEYRSFIAQFRSASVDYDGDWICFLSSYHEMHCRPNLFHVYKLCCISLSNSFVVPPTFTISLPDLTSDVDDFNSSIRTIQSSLVGVPNVSGLFSNPRTISPIFTLLGKGRGLFTDSAFSIWNVVSSSASRRHLFHNKLESRYTCTISDEETLWTSVVVSPKAAEPQASTSAKFVKPTPFPVRSSYIAPSPKSKSASPVLSTPTLSVSRVSADIPFLPNTSSDGSKKLVVKKKKKTSDR